MKTAALLAAASLLLASGAFAQSSAPSNNVPPPPGMNDPGVQAVAPPARTRTAPATTQSGSNQPALPTMQDGGNAGNSKQMSLPPQVTTRQEAGDEVQEYRHNGMLYMVVVTPKNGIPQTYNVDPDGTRRGARAAGDVQGAGMGQEQAGRGRFDRRYAKRHRPLSRSPNVGPSHAAA